MQNHIPTQMTAAVLTGHGGFDMLEIHQSRTSCGSGGDPATTGTQLCPHRDSPSARGVSCQATYREVGVDPTCVSVKQKDVSL